MFFWYNCLQTKIRVAFSTINHNLTLKRRSTLHLKPRTIRKLAQPSVKLATEIHEPYKEIKEGVKLPRTLPNPGLNSVTAVPLSGSAPFWRWMLGCIVAETSIFKGINQRPLPRRAKTEEL